MGAFLSHLVGKRLGDTEPSSEHEIDHNVCICCGNFNAASEHEKEGDVEKADGD